MLPDRSQRDPLCRIPQPPAAPGVTAERAREVLAVALGLWPLTGVMLLAVGLLVMASNWASP